MVAELVAHRGRIAHCLREPNGHNDVDAIEYFDDGILLVEQGHVTKLAPSDSILSTLSKDVPVINHGDRLLVPGFIDCHVHFPQIDVIGSYGEQLLEWLENYTFPTEMLFADAAHAHARAEFFIQQLLHHGTTTALVFATVHPHSVDAIFSAAQQQNMRLAAGKVLMDRHCPSALQDTPTSAYQDSRRLLEQWHQQDRLHYAITPRFAPTSSDEQLSAAGQLANEFPDAMVHTHLAENAEEIKWVSELFPNHRSYLDVYQQTGLLRERSVFAHCVHLDEQDYLNMSSCGGAMAFCPSSNLFLGSGLFDLERARQHNINVGLGTDVGGGTSLSLLQTMSDAYKTLQLRKQSLSSFSALYLATLGAAKTLSMDHKIGNFELGKEADFVVLDASPTALLERRLGQAKDIADTLFLQMTLGDDRSIAATYVMGKRVYANPASSSTGAVT